MEELAEVEWPHLGQDQELLDLGLNVHHFKVGKVQEEEVGPMVFSKRSSQFLGKGALYSSAAESCASSRGPLCSSSESLDGLVDFQGKGISGDWQVFWGKFFGRNDLGLSFQVGVLRVTLARYLKVNKCVWIEPFYNRWRIQKE